MPLYEYECKKCHHRFERMQKFSDPHVKKCPECGGRVEQVISAPAVQFKGSGWYVTDYSNRKSAPSASDTERKEKPPEKRDGDAAPAKKQPKAKKAD